MGPVPPTAAVHVAADAPPRASPWRNLGALVPLALGFVAMYTASGLRQGVDGYFQPAGWVSPAALGSALASLVAMVILSGATHGRRGPAAWALVAAAVVSLPVAIATWVRSYPLLRVDESARAGPGSPEYLALRVHWLESDAELARVDHDGLFGKRCTFLAFGPAHGFVRMVRPAALSGATGLLAHGGAAAWIGPDGCASVAASDDGRVLVGWSPVQWHDNAWGKGARADPFAIVGPDDPVSELDVAEIERLIPRMNPDEGLIPTDVDLVRALDSANPSVRDAAARFVRAGGASRYPEATLKLGD